MRVEKDFEELLGLFNRHKVRYCIVGAFAVALHSRPRYTKDLDILVDPTLENGRRIVKALKDFGFGSLKISERDFAQKGKWIQLGYEPVRADLITSLEGLDFDEVWKGRKRDRYGQHAVNFIGRQELIKAKRLAGRKQDLADLDILSASEEKET